MSPVGAPGPWGAGAPTRLKPVVRSEVGQQLSGCSASLLPNTAVSLPLVP
jgi:hypothetical protein